MIGHSELPTGLRIYLLAVIAAGPITAIGVAAVGGPSLDARGWVTAVMLMALLAIADRFPLELTHHTRIIVSTVASLTIVLVMPWASCALLAYGATVASQLARPRGERDWLESGFNAGQAALGAAAASGGLAVLRGWQLGPEVGNLAPVGAIVLTAATLHVVNLALVSAAAALQLECSPVRVFLASVPAELPEHVVLSALGLVAALLAAEHPWTLPIFGFPVLLVRSALGDRIRSRVETRAALATLVEVVELSDPYTAGHSQRVAELGRALALRIGMTAQEADLVESAGRVHDLGKVAIDGVVLTKPGRLTDEERLALERHPVLGAEVVANFSAYAGVYGMVRHHHERWDGGGYPDGLRGEAIPLGARILAVADSFDALTSNRPYRAGMSVDRALAILRDGAGSQWDAQVVAAMLAEAGPGLARTVALEGCGREAVVA